jgi:hypothetical protein
MKFEALWLATFESSATQGTATTAYQFLIGVLF